jgi:hypothetical protein
LSKTALGRALEAAGFVYQHRRKSGNLKLNRAEFVAEGLCGRRRVRGTRVRWMVSRRAWRCTRWRRQAAGNAWRCCAFEAKQSRFHRDVVLEEAGRRLTGAVADETPRTLTISAPV